MSDERDREREIFDAGFEACRSYGDNHHHYRGEEADRVFARAMERINAVKWERKASKAHPTTE